MNGAPKIRKSAPISDTVAVNTREVNVAVEGLNYGAIVGSFKVHLVKDGRRIASRFFFQASTQPESAQSTRKDRLAHFDFTLPIDVVADGTLHVEIEPAESSDHAVSLEQIGHPTLSVYLMLQSV